MPYWSNPYKPAPNPNSPIGPKLVPKKPDSCSPKRAGPCTGIPPALDRAPNVQIRQHREFTPPISNGQKSFLPKRLKTAVIGGKAVSLGDSGRWFDNSTKGRGIDGQITELLLYPDGSVYAVVLSPVKILLRRSASD